MDTITFPPEEPLDPARTSIFVRIMSAARIQTARNICNIYPTRTHLTVATEAEGVVVGVEVEMGDPEVHHIETMMMMTKIHPLTANQMLKALEMTTNSRPCPKDLLAHLGSLAGPELKLNHKKHPPVLTGNNSLPHTACLESLAYLLPAP
jgi:hypothetical protein